MKFVVFGASGRLGMINGERILDLEAASRGGETGREADPSVGSLQALIDSGDRGLEHASGLLDRFGGSDQPGLHVDTATTPLQAPFPGRRLACAGTNFAAHVADFFTNRGQPTAAEEVYANTRKGKPSGFWVVSPPVGPGADIPIPSVVDDVDTLFDYEAEVAVVLGKGGKRIPAEDWEERIWGTTMLIDWSLRPATGLAGARPFYGHKIFDCSKSMGPWISVGEVDPSTVEVELRVNGDVRQRFNNADMMHSYGEVLELLSGDLTLHAGDVLTGGTGPGTAADATVANDRPGSLDLYLKPGDVVEVSSPQLGTLDARIVTHD